MPEFLDELVTIRTRLEQLQRSHVSEMLWEDPARACQPFWDVALVAPGGDPDDATVCDDPPRPLVVFSAKPFVERRASRSRTR